MPNTINEKEKSADIPLDSKDTGKNSNSKQAKSNYGSQPFYHKEKPTFFHKKINAAHDYLLDHEKLDVTLTWTWLIFLTFVSAFAFSYGYRSFIAPSHDNIPSLISGGASGISQIILRIFQMCGYTGSEETIASVFYFVVNVPLFFLAFKKIGKKFFILTALNVAFTSLLIKFIPSSWTTIFNIDNDYIARAIFAGLTTGVSSGLAFFVGSSTGGMDVVSFYIAEKKSTTVGKYSIAINATIVLGYTVVNAIKLNDLSQVNMSLYTCIYFFTSSKVLDIINIKNKKTELQINTDKVELAPILLRAFPHGCTVIDAIGGYTGKARKVIYMVVSASEVKQVVSFARKIDPNCFVNVTNSRQVYGNFYTKPIQ